MNNQIFRIHGDNIIECERVVDFLAAGGNISRVATRMISAAVTEIEVLYIHGVANLSHGCSNYSPDLINLIGNDGTLIFLILSEMLEAS